MQTHYLAVCRLWYHLLAFYDFTKNNQRFQEQIRYLRYVCHARGHRPHHRVVGIKFVVFKKNESSRSEERRVGKECQ